MKYLDVPQSGSQGNTTASRNRSGQYYRQRSMPVQPNTQSQVNAKARFGTMSIAWRSLTDPQRAAWNAFANSFSVVNSLGQTIHLTGHQAFVKVNAVNLLNAVAMATAPPALPTFGANVTTAIEVTYGTQLLAITCGTIPANTVYMVYAAPALSVGRAYCADWRHLKSFTTATAAKLTITPEFTSKFGAIIAAKKYFTLTVQSMYGMQDNGVVWSGVPAT